MSIPSAIAEALDRIECARQAAGRTDHVALELAVKTRTPDECREAAQTLKDLGQPILLGHNRVQEAKATEDAIREVPGAQIHLIGPLQTNKINQALSCVDAIESIDSVALVEKSIHERPQNSRFSSKSTSRAKTPNTAVFLLIFPR